MDRANVAYLFASRGLRSFAAGFLAIAVSLYFYDVLKLSIYVIGALFAIGALATPLISLAVGMLGDRYGRKPVLLIDLLTLPLAVVLLLISKNVVLLAVATALGGFGTAGGLIGGGVGASVGPLVTALLADSTEAEERTWAFSVNSSISTFAGAAGALIVGFMGYRELFELGLVASFLSFVAALPLRDHQMSRRGEYDVAQLSQSDRRYLRAFMLTGIFNGLAMGLITPYYPIIFHVFFHMTEAQVGYLFSAGGVASGIAYFWTPSLSRRLGFLRTITYTRAISSAMMLVIPFSPYPLLASAMYVLMTPLRAVSLPAQSSLMMGLLSEGRRATGSGLNQASRLLASAAATYAGGAMLGGLPMFAPFILAFGINYVNIGIYLKLFSGIPEAVGRGKDINPE